MGIGAKIAEFSVNRPKLVTLLMIQLTIILAVLAALPSVWPDTFESLNGVKVDTDPENMLPKDEPVRVTHDRMKEKMSLHDMIVIGVVNEKNPNGVFNVESLNRIKELTDYAKNLRGEKLFDEELPEDDPRRDQGVIQIDIIAPSMVDNIRQENGSPVYEWLMRPAPKTEEEALAVREKAQNIPFLNGTLVSEDGKAVAIYLPLTSKDLSYKVYSKLQAKISEFDGDEQFHITGLPVAEDTFGVEMFRQMAISAPLAMLVIFILMLVFFRKLSLIISPMIVAMVCVILTMSLLIITDNTIHIMSSMIPIFIMPIAVLDAVHILSEFFDRYQATKDRRQTIISVMDTLFWPMLYTSVTTAVGFGSLALTPIPPVQVFGIFVAFGVAMAWLWTITFIPAYVMFIKEKSFENFGSTHHEEEVPSSPLMRLLGRVGNFTYNHAKLVMAGVGVLVVVAVIGINQIQINDNPIKWFVPDHPIRKADKVLNEHFGGTYMAYLALEAQQENAEPGEYAAALKQKLQTQAEQAENEQVKAAFNTISDETATLTSSATTQKDVLTQLEDFAYKQQDTAAQNENYDVYDAWDNVLTLIGKERTRRQVFKRPEALKFVEDLQKMLLTVKRANQKEAETEKDTALVGKSNAVTEIVKTVGREYQSGTQEDYRIPDGINAVGQFLFSYQQSNRPQDLWHFVTRPIPDEKKPGFGTAVIWIQLKSGDNMDMSQVIKAVDAYMAKAPRPEGVNISHKWFGLTYINVVWQDKMVAGMLQAFLGSFLIVFLLMTLLYRSALWGLLSMVPLTITIGLIYGAIGLIGKDYDMPTAVLSSLSLGLAVDYAIHFLSRSRQLYMEHKSWRETVGPVFGEPAQAIARNVVVIGVGFLPLLFAPLMPYKTVGIFIAAILVTAGLASLLILPSLITLLEPLLFPRTKRCCIFCNVGTMIAGSAALIAAVAINLHQFAGVGWTKLAWASLIAILLAAQAAYLMGRSKRCKLEVPISD